MKVSQLLQLRALVAIPVLYVTSDFSNSSLLSSYLANVNFLGVKCSRINHCASVQLYASTLWG